MPVVHLVRGAIVAVSILLVASCGNDAPRPRKPLAPCPALPAGGMRLWLRADAGVETDESGAVLLWKDQSPEHNDLAQKVPANRPARAISVGRNVVRFEERTASLYNDTLTGPMDDLTVAIVLTPIAFDGNSQFFGGRDWNQFRFHGGEDGILLTGTSFESRMDTTRGLPKGLLVQHERQRYVFLRQGDTASLSRNGNQLLSHPSDKPAPWTGFQLGHDDNVSVFRGDVAEVLVYRRALASAELAQLDTYFRMKYWDLPGCISR